MKSILHDLHGEYVHFTSQPIQSQQNVCEMVTEHKYMAKFIINITWEMKT